MIIATDIRFMAAVIIKTQCLQKRQISLFFVNVWFVGLPVVVIGDNKVIWLLFIFQLPKTIIFCKLLFSSPKNTKKLSKSCFTTKGVVNSRSCNWWNHDVGNIIGI